MKITSHKLLDACFVTVKTVCIKVSNYFANLTRKELRVWLIGTASSFVLTSALSFFLSLTLASKDDALVMMNQSNIELQRHVNVLTMEFFDYEREYTDSEEILALEYRAKYDDTRRDVGIKKIIKQINSISKKPLEQAYVKVLAKAFYDYSHKFDLDPTELVSVAWVENRFNPTRVSVVGARGVMQVMPFWAKNKALRKACGIKNSKDFDDPIKGICGGSYVLAFYHQYWAKRGVMNDKYKRKLALLTYNRGQKFVKRDLRSGNDPENGYHIDVVEKIKVLENSL